MDLISKKTRSEFQEFLVSITIKEIKRYFDNHDIQFIQLPTEKLPSGERRSQVAQYYASVDWTNPKMVQQMINVYSDILSDLTCITDSLILYDKQTWYAKLNKVLLRDGYHFDNGKISIIGQVVSFGDLENATDLLDRGHFQEYIDRIKRSVDQDPELAIGSTKELVESTLKTILSELKIPASRDDDIPKLLKQVQKALDLVPDEVNDAKRGAEIIKVLLSNLGQIVIKIAELRNLYGTGHGRDKKRKGLNERHARLAVGAGVTLSTFLLETLELKRHDRNE
jgi:hypothetical protein